MRSSSVAQLTYTVAVRMNLVPLVVIAVIVESNSSGVSIELYCK